MVISTPVKKKKSKLKFDPDLKKELALALRQGDSKYILETGNKKSKAWTHAAST